MNPQRTSTTLFYTWIKKYNSIITESFLLYNWIKCRYCWRDRACCVRRVPGRFNLLRQFESNATLCRVDQRLASRWFWCRYISCTTSLVNFLNHGAWKQSPMGLSPWWHYHAPLLASTLLQLFFNSPKITLFIQTHSLWRCLSVLGFCRNVVVQQGWGSVYI